VDSSSHQTTKQKILKKRVRQGIRCIRKTLWFCHDYVCDYRSCLDWRIDLLTTYTHHSEPHVITALSLISTLYKSPQHLLSLFQPAVSSPAVSWQWFLTVEILQFRAHWHSRPRRTDWTHSIIAPFF
jgi:hypothetical protein